MSQKVLVIGGNRFVGLRLTHALAGDPKVDLHIVNRTGQAPHAPGATIYKADRKNWHNSFVGREWDTILDFACFNEEDARGSLEHFRSVKKYILISSEIVYEYKPNLIEKDFDPLQFDLSRPSANSDYQDGKRRAEAVFAQNEKQFPLLTVRFPFILGPEDYTHRLEFHVARVAHNQPIYAPLPHARFSCIHAEDACSFLEWSLNHPQLTGPLNVASPIPISLSELLSKIEIHVGKKALLAATPTSESTSPYGTPADSYMCTDLCKQRGFSARPVGLWLDGLIDEIAVSLGIELKRRLH